MSLVPFPLNEDEQVLYMLHSQRPVYTGKDILLYLIPGDFLMLLAFYIAFEMDFPVVIPADIQAYLSEPLALILMFVFGVLLPLAPMFHGFMRSRTLYVFTNQRAVIYHTPNKEIELEVPVEALADMKLVKHDKGLISLLLWQNQQSTDGTEVFVRNGFEYIPERVLQDYPHIQA